jgi:hypothetical protein
MKSSKFNEKLANLKLQLFLGAAFWGCRCGSQTNFGRASDALPATILGALVEMR